MTPNDMLMIIGFTLAAYSVVSNDSIQTLGTFLAANAERQWWVLWGFASSILVGVLLYGWIVNSGDPSYGRLAKFPEPTGGLNWLHIGAPLILLLLTRWGIPVSTTFLVLSVFAPGNIESMLSKSLLGYLVAFVVAIVLYTMLRKFMSSFLAPINAERSKQWVVLQWAATAFLWSQWLVQDLANIFVFLPRELSLNWLLFGTVILVAMQGYTFYQKGGAIQEIVRSKQAVTDIRAATLIDLSYGLILLFFKELSAIPMSTTWVFLGLLAGREIAITLHMDSTDRVRARKLILADATKAGLGLVISVALAVAGIYLTDSN